MKILILGSEGFIGRHCIKYFLKKGYNVHGCDLIDYPSNAYAYLKISRLNPSFKDAFYDIKYDVCINTAGNGSVPVSVEHPLTDFEANCTDVISLLELIRTKNNECRYLHISSAAVYGNPATLPIRENDDLKPVSPYGWHKFISEKICQEYTALYNISTAIVRPFSVYGPGLKKQLIWDLYLKSRHLKKEDVLELWGTGKESRDFIFIEDLIYAFDTILHSGEMKSEVYNIAGGTEITIEEVSKLFFSILGKKVYVRFNEKERPGDPKNWLADITKLKGLGFQTQTDIFTGLTKTTEWLKDFASA